MQLLNTRAAGLLEETRTSTAELRVTVHDEGLVSIVDFGVQCDGGLNAGLLLARLCMSDLAEISITPDVPLFGNLPLVQVRTDHPVAACLMSQYAGWKIATEDYFAMGSGPMRALAGNEELFKDLPPTAEEDVAVGILESNKLPTPAAVEKIRASIGESRRLILAVAPTASQAGNLQVVARSVETTLHKLHELHFPLSSILSGSGTAPLPPIAKNDLHGIGRTNDAILYGGTVHLWVRCEDEQIQSIGEQVPSCASASHGQTFLSLFKAANYDFYALDPALFSPAIVIFHNLKSGRTFQYGRHLPELIKSSFEL